MEYRTLGGTGTIVSSLCLGTMTFGNESVEEVSHAQLDRFVERGGNFVDTADVYGGTESERILGRLLGSVVNRDDVVVATKAVLRFGADVQRHQDASRGHLLRALDASL